MDAFLAPTAVIDWTTPAVTEVAAGLAVPGDPVATARACFTFVRDEVRHSRDHEVGPSTCRASDVLRHRTGFCYAKSHLLAGLLRANGLPAGLCYQRLSVNDAGPPFSLHGFNAVLLPGLGWYRIDARGNRPGVRAAFDPPRERLAFRLQCDQEFEFDNVLPDPLDVVVRALEASTGWADVLRRLPDVPPAQFAALGLEVRRRGVSFEPAAAEDFEDLLALRIEAMRESLERLGRFDPARARERFAGGFEPARTRHVVVDGERIGFVVVKPRPDHLLLDHLYVRPARQGAGMGSAVLAAVFAEADAAGLPVRLGALRGSDANRFYQRHGFRQTGEAEWDVYYERPATGTDGEPARPPGGRCGPAA